LTIALYAIIVAATVWGLLAARRAAISSLGSADEQAHWDQFRAQMDERHAQREAIREEIARQSGQPIERQPPKSRSPRPPALELLTQHFAACLVVSLLGVSGLFAVMWSLFVGAALRPGRTIADSADDNAALNIRPSDTRQLR
jgi:hypothetical protein